MSDNPASTEPNLQGNFANIAEQNSLEPSTSNHDRPEDQRVIVRRALGANDFAPVLEAVRSYHQESRYAHIPFSERKISSIFHKAMGRPDKTLVLYARYGGRSIGVVHATVGEYYLGEGGRLATVLGIYVSQDIRMSVLGGRVAIRLLRAASEWARGCGADEITVHATSGLGARSVDSTLRRSGFSLLGGAYFSSLARSSAEAVNG